MTTYSENETEKNFSENFHKVGNNVKNNDEKPKNLDFLKNEENEGKTMKPYHIRLFIKAELKKRNMRKVELVILNKMREKCACLPMLGKIYLDKSYLKLNHLILKAFISHEIDHIQIYRLLRNNKKLELMMQKMLDDELEKKFKKIFENS